MTSFLPDDWTWRIARWITRWKPCVGCVSASGVRRQPRRVLADEIGQDAAQLLEVDAAGLQDLGRRRVVEHREQQVLDGDELVLLLPRLDKSHVEGNFQFLRNHRSVLRPFDRRRCRRRGCTAINAYVSSIVHWSGCWCLRAMFNT